MDRYSLRRQAKSGSNPWRVYLHRFLAGDGDGWHNHPSQWGFSIVLWGSYTEEVLVKPDDDYGHEMYDAQYRADGSVVLVRRVRWFNWIPASKYHRIVALHPARPGGSVWTLFIPGPLARHPELYPGGPRRPRGWGFWVAGKGHVPWEQHIGPQPLAVPPTADEK